MLRALYTAATGMYAQQLNVDVIAHNLSNVNTTGYRRSRVEFRDLAYDIIRPEVAGGPPAGYQVGHGVVALSTPKSYRQGNFEQTERDLDLAIEGRGFFQVRLPDGTTGYTRDGSFQLSANGRIVTQEGNELIIRGNATIPADAERITIDRDGTVMVLTGASSTPTQLGTIELAFFRNPAGLESRGGNVMVATVASGQPTTASPGSRGAGVVLQGYLERSNVQVLEEMVGLITAQRAYELNSKVVSASDEMMGITNNVRRG